MNESHKVLSFPSHDIRHRRSDFECGCVVEALNMCRTPLFRIKNYFQIANAAVTLQLIDIGVVIRLESLNDHKIYNLTEEAKLTPIRANLCQIEKVINFPFD